MRQLFTYAVVLSISIANAQPLLNQLPIVEDSDSAFPALMEWQRNFDAEHPQEGVFRDFNSWCTLPFSSLTVLFPQYRFFTITWSEFPVPGTEKEHVGLGVGVRTTLVCDAAGKPIKGINYTCGESFEDLLIAKKIVIRNNDDAKLVWNAFCDFHQKHWQAYPAIKIDEKTWHLGNVTIDGVHYYKEVLLDSNFRVMSTKRISDRINKP